MFEKKARTSAPHRNAEKMIKNSLKKSIVREHEYLARKKIRRNKTDNCEIIFDSYQFKEVESCRTYVSSYRQMVLPLYKNEKLHHIIVNLLDNMDVPCIFNNSLARSVRNVRNKKSNMKSNHTIHPLCVYIYTAKTMKYWINARWQSNNVTFFLHFLNWRRNKCFFCPFLNFKAAVQS